MKKFLTCLSACHMDKILTMRDKILSIADDFSCKIMAMISANRSQRLIHPAELSHTRRVETRHQLAILMMPGGPP